MPLRSQSPVELCRRCKEPAEQHCLRCGTPLCLEHAPIGGDDRCERCEAEYTEKTEWLQKAADGHLHSMFGRPFVAFMSVFVVSLGVNLGWWFGPAGMISGAVAGAVAAATWYRKTPPRELAARRMLGKRRRRFLARRARRLPELPPAPPTD